MMKEELSLQFQCLKFMHGETTIAPSSLFMGQNGPQRKILFSSFNNSESKTYPWLYIESPRPAIKSDYVSPPGCYEIMPGETSGLMVIPLDSICKNSHAEMLRIQFEGIVKNDRDTKAGFCITSLAGKGPFMVWEKPLSEITNKSEVWTYASFYVDVPRTELEQKGRLYYSLSNIAGKSPVLLDDFGVTITEK
jgi:hypothetical protein